MKDNSKIPDEKLLFFYVENNYSIKKISEETGIYVQWISGRLKELNISIRNGNNRLYYDSRKKAFLPCIICGDSNTMEYNKTGIFYCSRHYSQLEEYGRILPRTKFDKNEIHLFQDYAILDLYDIKNIKNGECIIDLEDLEILIKYKWVKDKQGYVVTQIKGEDNKKHRTTMHRFLINPFPKDLIDHINCNKSDNRKENLRVVNKSKNEMNKPIRSNNTSGVRGISWNKNSWVAELSVNGVSVLKKRFKIKEDAIQARKIAEKKYFGEYAYKGDSQ